MVFISRKRCLGIFVLRTQTSSNKLQAQQYLVGWYDTNQSRKIKRASLQSATAISYEVYENFYVGLAENFTLLPSFAFGGYNVDI